MFAISEQDVRAALVWIVSNSRRNQSAAVLPSNSPPTIASGLALLDRHILGALHNLRALNVQRSCKEKERKGTELARNRTIPMSRSKRAFLRKSRSR